MTTVLFVHGIGVRKAQYKEDFQRVQSELQKEFTVEPCLWGDMAGAKFHYSGLSIPHYNTTGGQVTREQLEIELWEHLYADSLFELRALAIGSGSKRSTLTGATLGQELDYIVRQLENVQKFPELYDKLQEAEIDTVFGTASTNVYNSEPCRIMRPIVPTTRERYQKAIVTAIIAEAIALASQQQPSVSLLYDAVLRDQVIFQVERVLGYTSTTMGPGGWVITQLLGMRRGHFMDHDFLAKKIGDVLVYQARGDGIRNIIRMRIGQVDKPVVLLAHSLGGVACVDLLIREDLRERVKLLITVGSQAPYFYEIGALHSLASYEPLPKHFPEHWVNLYDPSDFLGFIGEKLFPETVKDIPVNSRQPFPQSHGAYWTNPTTWTTVIDAIQTHVS